MPNLSQVLESMQRDGNMVEGLSGGLGVGWVEYAERWEHGGGFEWGTWGWVGRVCREMGTWWRARVGDLGLGG